VILVISPLQEWAGLTTIERLDPDQMKQEVGAGYGILEESSFKSVHNDSYRYLIFTNTQ
jgi:hypothetical protein